MKLLLAMLLLSAPVYAESMEFETFEEICEFTGEIKYSTSYIQTVSVVEPVSIDTDETK